MVFLHVQVQTNGLIDDITYNDARQIVRVQRTRKSVIDDLAAWEEVYKQSQHEDAIRIQSFLTLPPVFVTLENFVEAAVYLSPRATQTQKVDLAFTIFDGNGDGMIETHEIEQVLMKAWKSLEDGITESPTSAGSVFQKEVEGLIDDLKHEFSTNKFSRKMFYTFARDKEFIHYFASNKHWLRDILSDEKREERHWSTHQAQLKQFLTRVEGITDEADYVEDMLRDHLIDNLSDLSEMTVKDFEQMYIDKKIAIAIIDQLSKQNKEKHHQSQFLTLSQRQPDDDGFNSAARNDNIRDYLHVSKYDGCLNGFLPYSKAMSLFYVLIVITLLIISQIIIHQQSTMIIDFKQLSNHGLHCIFVTFHLPLLYPILPKFLSINANHTFFLWITSVECQNTSMLLFTIFSIVHVLFYQIQQINSFNLFGWILFGILFIFATLKCLLQVSIKIKKKFQTNHNYIFLKNAILNFILPIAIYVIFGTHCVTKMNSNRNSNISYFSLSSLAICAIVQLWTFCEKYLFRTKADVIKVDSELPNFVVLTLDKPKQFSKFKCNQYLQLSCPSISRYECHPYYILNDPTSRNLKVSIRASGDWSSKLWTMYGVQHNRLSNLSISGPFGVGYSMKNTHALSQDYDIIMIVASDVQGIQSVSSLLHHLCNKYLDENNETNNNNNNTNENENNNINQNNKIHHWLFKIYFYWLVDPNHSVMWIYDMITKLKHKYPTRFEPKIFVGSEKNIDKNPSNFGIDFILSFRRKSFEKLTFAVGKNNSGLNVARMSSFRQKQNQIDKTRFSVTFGHNVSIGLSSLAMHQSKKQTHVHTSQHSSHQNVANIPVSDLTTPIQSHNDNNNTTHNNFNHSHSNSAQKPNNIIQNLHPRSKKANEIPVESPNFRSVFLQVREQFTNLQSGFYQFMQSNPTRHRRFRIESHLRAASTGSTSRESEMQKMRGIVPELIVASSMNTMNQSWKGKVSLIYHGTPIISKQLHKLCNEYSDDLVTFHFHSQFVNHDYSRAYC